MKSAIARTLSATAVAALVAVFVVFAVPAQTASAARAHLQALKQRDALSAPITLIGAPPGLIIAAFEGSGAVENGIPEGVFEGAQVAPSDGKPVTVFAPVGMATSIYAFDREGYWLLGMVNPSTSDDKSVINVAGVLNPTP
jgi:hypothetical protein